MAAFAVRMPVTVVTIAYCAAMFGLGVLSPLWETTMQQRIPEEALGRVGPSTRSSPSPPGRWAWPSPPPWPH